MTITLELVDETVAEKNPPRIAETKIIKKQIRFEPQDVEEYKNACFPENIAFCDFIREAADLMKIYIKHREILMTRSDEIIPLLRIIRRKR